MRRKFEIRGGKFVELPVEVQDILQKKGKEAER